MKHEYPLWLNGLKGLTLFTERLVKWIVSLSLFFMTVVIIINVLARYFLDYSIFWADEFSLYTLMWVTFFGSCLAIKYFQLPMISILLDVLKGKYYTFLFILIHVIILIFSVIFFWLSYEWLTSDNLQSQVSAGMRIPIWIPYMSLPISMLINIIFTVYNIVGKIVGNKVPREEY